jgi:5-methylthioribose kinase
VSNIVLRVEPENGAAFVLKQSRERLRTEAAWFSRLDRIWRETAAMRALAPILPAGALPQILFEDRENYLFAMESADPKHTVWKDELLSGQVRPAIAERLGTYLSTIHARTFHDPALESAFGDREVFVQLRLDPFYRRIAAVHPELAPLIESLIAEMWDTRLCLVHADFSPKNVLVTEPVVGASDAGTGQGTGNREQGTADGSKPDAGTRGRGDAGRRPARIMLVDFETAHFGDPAFDLGFFLSHLLLKGVRAGPDVSQFTNLARTFWQRYVEGMTLIHPSSFLLHPSLQRRAVTNLAGCMLARVDGTSPVGYLSNPNDRELVRDFCRRLFLARSERLSDVFSDLEDGVRALHGPDERK